MELRDILINFRNENNMSQREFARRAGLSNSLISIIENGINPQTGRKMQQNIETYKSIANVMGISLHELFDQLDDNETVNLRPLVEERIVIKDSDLFKKIIMNMSPEDYRTVMEIFEKTEMKMKEKGIL